MNILQAIEKLSAAKNVKKDGEDGAPEKHEAPERGDGAEPKQIISKDLSLAESLLSRHERSVYRIKNCKK